jgi:murein DD-endopeptidase MepM/ murein hydrolase activator NlpD
MSGFLKKKFTIFLSAEGGNCRSISISGKSILSGIIAIISIITVFSLISLKLSSNYKASLDIKDELSRKDKLEKKIDSLSLLIDEYNKKSSEKWDTFNNISQLYEIARTEKFEDTAGIGGKLLGRDSDLLNDKRIKEMMGTYYRLTYQMMNYDELYTKAEFEDKVRKSTPTLKPTEGHYTSFFGWRFGGAHFHRGLDIANECGTPIYASADGIVTRAGPAPSYGLVVYIDHGFGLSTRYGHLSKLNVVEGQEVKRGQLIAKMGRSGWATGCHLHYEVRVHGVAVDPLNYIIEDEIVD